MRIAVFAPFLALASAAAAAVALPGCGSPVVTRGERTDGQTIMPARGRLPTEPYSPVDQPGQLPYDNRGLGVPTRDAPRTGAGPSTAAARVLDDAVPQLAQPADPSRPPATRPTSAAASPGTYLTIGGVVAEVNSVPIYAHKVISQIEPLLAAQARQLS